MTNPLMKDMIKQIFEGVNYLHSRYPVIIHCDIKPDNILYDERKNLIKICDFGVSQIMEKYKIKGFRGTMNFMAPEIFTGSYDEMVDIYAIGMTIIFMATLRLPFSSFGEIDLEDVKRNNIPPYEVGYIEDSKMLTLVKECIKYNKKSRPSCQQVLDSQYYGFRKKKVKYYFFGYLIFFYLFFFFYSF